MENAPTDSQWPRMVHCSLRELGAELRAATAASDHDDWATTLEAVCIIQGKAIVTRRILERMLGSNAAADLPPLVRAIQAVKRIISDQEVESLAPDELRVRVYAMLEALDRELQAFLELPEETPAPADGDRDGPPDSPYDPQRP